MKKAVAVFAVVAMAGGALAQSVSVDITGVDSVNELGDSANIVLMVNLGIANAEVTSISWDLSYTPVVPSWTEEPNMQFSDSAQGSIYNWDMGDWGGTNSSVPISLFGGDSTSFFVGGDGMLRIEFWEDFVDFGGADGFYDRGGLVINFTPAPSSVALLGLGGLMAMRRHR